MPDWTSSMQQTFEYYKVDPDTWEEIEKLNCVIGCTINRDSEAETLGSAQFEITEPLNECYVRVYLITIQNGIRERFPLGTFLVQTPSSKFNGRSTTYSVDAYTPLLELKENPPPFGYSILKKDEMNIMDLAYQLTKYHSYSPHNHMLKLYYDWF